MKEQQLNDLSIFALRELARRVGVNSPTSKRKNELIEEIVAIKEGRQQPVVVTSRQGRPPKGFVLNLNNILQKDEKALTLNQNIVNENAEKYIASGYVEKLSNNVGFLWVKNNEKFINYFMPMSAFVDEVLTGDFVTAEMVKNNDGVVAKQILTVEGNDVKQLKNRQNFEDLEHLILEKEIKQKNANYSNLNVNCGENIYIYGANNNYKTNHLIGVLNSCEADAKIYINLAMVEKNKAYLNNIENAEIFTTNMIDEIDYVKRIMNLCIERAKRYVENGKNVVIAIDDVLTISSIDFYSLKKLMALTKNTVLGSVTILAVMSNSETINIFVRLADKRFNAEKEKLIEC